MTLKDDIDLPLVNTIAYLNLLGVKTLWCCCGYNYKDQPTHKSHQLGQVNISMEASELAATMGVRLISWNPNLFLKYQLVAPSLRSFIIFCDIIKFHPNWNETSMHYHEFPSQIINGIEKNLYCLKDQFANETILTDTNQTSKAENPYWGYPARDSWIIKKSDYIK
jgi:hypothetical protein